MKNLILMLVFFNFSYSLAVNLNRPINSYKLCLHHSNFLNTPFTRDTEKINCFFKFKQSQSETSCIKLSKVLEYTTLSDQLLTSCLEDFGKTVESCQSIAKSMNYGETADQALWKCIELTSNKKHLRQCDSISQNMRLPHDKRRAKEYCQNLKENL